MNDPRPIDGQLAPAKSEQVVAGGHVFSPVILGKGDGQTLHRLSQREQRFVSKFLDTNNIELASLEIGIDAEAGKKYIRRPAIKEYLRDMLEQRALAQGLTLDKLMATLHKAVDGIIDLTPSQRDAIKTAAKILKPSIMSLQVNNTQINNNGASAGNSPYAKMSGAELENEWRQRLADAKPIEVKQ